HRDIPALRFWDTIDREQFELALSDHDKNDKYATFLQALSDPTYARCSFPTLLRKFNISLHEAQSIYTDHMRHMALLQMSSQLPEVIADVTEDARVTCGLVPDVTARRLSSSHEQTSVSERNVRNAKAQVK